MSTDSCTTRLPLPLFFEIFGPVHDNHRRLDVRVGIQKDPHHGMSITHTGTYE